MRKKGVSAIPKLDVQRQTKSERMQCRNETISQLSVEKSRYSICIRQEEGFCCVEYEVCPDQRTILPAKNDDGLPAGFSFDQQIKSSMHDNK